MKTLSRVKAARAVKKQEAHTSTYGHLYYLVSLCDFLIFNFFFYDTSRFNTSNVNNFIFIIFYVSNVNSFKHS